MIPRREFIKTAGISLLPLSSCTTPALDADGLDGIRISGVELLPVRATYRTVWLFVKLHTSNGLTGIGEASDAFGFANTTRDNAATMQAELNAFYELLKNQSPFSIQAFRMQGRARAARGLVSATAFSALEQCLWDLAGQLLDVPVYELFGGKVRDSVPLYANINRATNPRSPAGFAESARRAYADGFRAMKAAPFDNYPVNGSKADQEAHIAGGVEALFAMREAVGNQVALMVDCHSFFSISQAVSVAEQLEPVNLTWYEEPVPPDHVDSTITIKEGIVQPMAGGELLFGLEGFRPLIQRQAFDVIMPDVKHCGGLQEMLHIGALAETENIQVAPHNPSGPVSTAAGVQVAAAMPNCNYLELQYGEVDWRSGVLVPGESFVDGRISVPDAPGLGVRLDEQVIASNRLPL